MKKNIIYPITASLISFCIWAPFTFADQDIGDLINSVLGGRGEVRIDRIALPILHTVLNDSSVNSVDAIQNLVLDNLDRFTNESSLNEAIRGLIKIWRTINLSPLLSTIFNMW